MPSATRRHQRPSRKVALSRWQKEARKRLRKYDGPDAELRGFATTLLNNPSWTPRHDTAVRIVAQLDGDCSSGHQRSAFQARAIAALLNYRGSDSEIRAMRTRAQRDPHWSPSNKTAGRIIKACRVHRTGR